jgi:hypothetical protein
MGVHIADTGYGQILDFSSGGRTDNALETVLESVPRNIIP